MTHNPDIARAARQVADKANFHARAAAYEDEGYPQSYSQWRKLSRAELAEDDLALVPVDRISPTRIAL